MMNVHGCVRRVFFFFPKYDISELSVGLIPFFNKKLITIVLRLQLYNYGWKVFRRLGVKVDTKIRGAQQNVGLFLIFSE